MPQNNPTEKGCYTQVGGFSLIPSTHYDFAQWRLSPLVDFHTTWGRWLNVIQIFVAVGVIAVPSGGLIPSGFFS